MDRLYKQREIELENEKQKKPELGLAVVKQKKSVKKKFEKDLYQTSWILDIWNNRLNKFIEAKLSGYKYLIVYLDHEDCFNEKYIFIKDNKTFLRKYLEKKNIQKGKYIQCIYNLRENWKEQIYTRRAIFNYPKNFKDELKIELTNYHLIW